MFENDSWTKQVIQHHINNNVVAGVKLIYQHTKMTLSEAKQISDQLIKILVEMNLIPEQKLSTHFFSSKSNDLTDKQWTVIYMLKLAAIEEKKMMSVFNEKLKQYAEEIGVGDLSLDGLIDSHRHLRSINCRNNEWWLHEVEKAREAAYNDAKQYALEHNFISTEALKKMTMEELSKFLCDDCCD